MPDTSEIKLVSSLDSSTKLYDVASFSRCRQHLFLFVQFVRRYPVVQFGTFFGVIFESAAIVRHQSDVKEKLLLLFT